MDQVRNPANKIRKGWSVYVMLGFILCLGAFLRFYQLGTNSLWTDEFTTVTFSATDKTVAEVIHLASGVHVQPPLSYLIRHFVMFIGQSDFWVRLPEAVFGVLAIAVVYKIATRLFDLSVGLVAAFLLSISTMHIYYSREARPYSLIVLLSLLGGYFFYLAITENKPRDWIGYITFTLLGLYTNIFIVLVIVVEFFYLIIIALMQKVWPIKQERYPKFSIFFKFFLCVGIVILLFLPLVPVLTSTSFEKLTGNSSTEFLITIKTLLPISILYRIFNAFSAFPLSIPQLTHISGVVAVLGFSIAFRQESTKAIFIGCISVIFVFLLSLAFILGSTSALKTRYAISALPWFIMAISVGIGGLGQWISQLLRRWSSFSIPAWIVGLMIAFGLFGLVSLPSIQDIYLSEKPDWKRSALFIAQVLQPGDKVVVWPGKADRHFFYYYSNTEDILKPKEWSIAWFENELLMREQFWFVRTDKFRKLSKKTKSVENWLTKNKFLTFRMKRGAIAGHAESVYITYIHKPKTLDNELVTKANLLQEAIRLKSDGWDIHKNLGDVYTKQRRLKAAIKEYQAAIVLLPEYVSAYIALGQVLLKDDQPKEAIAVYQQGLSVRPKNVHLQLALMQAYQANGQVEAAIRELEQATKIDVRRANAKTWHKLGDLALEFEALALAVHFYQKARTVNPAYLNSYLKLADIYLKQNQPNKALTLYKQAIKRDPTYAQAYFYQGKLLQEQGRLEQAVASYWQAHRLVEVQAPYFVKRTAIRLSNLLMAQGEIQTAVDVVQESLTRLPKANELQKQAIKIYQQALKMDPDNYNIRFDLANIYDAQGLIDEAGSEFQKILESIPQDDRLAKQARQWLDEHESP